MKDRAPRNQTLILSDDEKVELMNQIISLESPCNPCDIEDKLIKIMQIK